MHADTIAKIDGGFTFHKKLENGELVGCNDDMRAACAEQIKLCDAILENVGKMASMPAELLRPIEIMLQDAQEHVAKALDKAEAEGADDALPEIGNYDHKAD